MANKIFSLGHSSLSFEEFARLLKASRIDAVADVRSSPFSKQSPWFTQSDLRAGLREKQIAYAFLGKELGGRPKDQHLFDAGIADYRAMAKTDLFQAGIERLLQGLEKHVIAMVCSERDPLHCHRCLLVGRELEALGICTHHIHANGTIETQDQSEERLLKEEGLEREDFLYSRADRLSEAYARRNKQVAYSTNTDRAAEIRWRKV